jgi:hypothetical protein
MPWTPKQAKQHNKGADTKKKRKVWASVANRELEAHGDEGRAIRIANTAVENMTKAHDVFKAVYKSYVDL